MDHSAANQTPAAAPRPKLTDQPNYREREYYRRQAFVLMLQLVFIIGLPAAAATYFGQKLDTAHDTGRLYSLSLAGTAFVLSWIIIIIKYKRYIKAVKQSEQRIKNRQTKTDTPNPL